MTLKQTYWWYCNINNDSIANRPRTRVRGTFVRLKACGFFGSTNFNHQNPGCHVLEAYDRKFRTAFDQI